MPESLTAWLGSDALARIEASLQTPSLLSVIDQTRREPFHTMMLGWLMNPHARHGLGAQPLQLFLTRFLPAIARLPLNTRAIGAAHATGLTAIDWRNATEVEALFASWDLSRAVVRTEAVHDQSDEESDGETDPAPEHGGQRKRNRLDLRILIPPHRSSAAQPLAIFLENKIDATENRYDHGETWQTTRYRKAVEADHPDAVRLFVYLTPYARLNQVDLHALSKEIRSYLPRDAAFLAASYQVVLDEILSATALPGSGPGTSLVLDYVVSLSTWSGAGQSLPIAYSMAQRLDARAFLAQARPALDAFLAAQDGRHDSIDPAEWDRFAAKKRLIKTVLEILRLDADQDGPRHHPSSDIVDTLDQLVRQRMTQQPADATPAIELGTWLTEELRRLFGWAVIWERTTSKGFYFNRLPDDAGPVVWQINGRGVQIEAKRPAADNAPFMDLVHRLDTQAEYTLTPPKKGRLIRLETRAKSNRWADILEAFVRLHRDCHAGLIEAFGTDGFGNTKLNGQ